MHVRMKTQTQDHLDPMIYTISIHY